MARELAQTPAYACSKRERNKIEALFSELKLRVGLRRVRLRRLWNVSEQFYLAATAQNLKRLVRFLAQRESVPDLLFRLACSQTEIARPESEQAKEIKVQPPSIEFSRVHFSTESSVCGHHDSRIVVLRFQVLASAILVGYWAGPEGGDWPSGFTRDRDLA